MLLHTGGHRQHIGVEDDVRRTETHLVDQQAIGPLADGNAAFVGIGLSLLVESHHHHGSTQATDEAGMLQEKGLPLLQRNGVDNGLALHALQSGHDDVPLRGINHHRHTGNLGFGSNQIKKGRHLLAGIEQTVVHVDVDYLRPVFHLTAGNAESLLVILFIDQPQELARAGHVAAFAHVDKVVFGLHLQQFEAGEPKVFRRSYRNVGSHAFHQGRKAGNVFFGRTATAADDVHQPFAHILAHLAGHLVGCLVVLAQAVGQAGIGIGADVIRGTGSQLLQEGFQLAGTERTVQAHRENVGMLNRSQEGIQRLAGQGTAGRIGNGDGEHQRHAAARIVHRLPGGIEGGFGIERVEDGLDEQRIDPTLQQGCHLLAVGIGQVVEGQGTVSGIAHIGAHGASLVGRTYGAGHEAGLLGRREGIGCLTGQTGGGQVDIAHAMLHMVVGLADARGVERIGFDDVGTGSQILAVDVRHDVGTGEAQQVVVALQLSGYILENLAAKIGFSQVVLLYHGAHRTVQNQDAPAHQLLQGHCI